MPAFQKIIGQHKNLCSYCDAFWKRTKDRYPTEIKCSPGCSACCVLQSVNFLEAYLIADRHAAGGTPSSSLTGDKCHFLEEDKCRIYPVRPLICRTHGLLLKSREFRGRFAPSCAQNFTCAELSAADDAYSLDIDRITNNLARLNAAFCILLGDLKKAKERIAVGDLADGSIGREWFGLKKN
jgi:Fe-S-cluster containining protein